MRVAFPVDRVDPRDVAPGERCVIDVAFRRGGDAVRTGAAGRVEHFDVLDRDPAVFPYTPR